VGLDVTQRLRLSEADLAAMRDAGNIDEGNSAPCDTPFAPEHGSFLHAISEFYMAFHVRTTGFRGIFMHDPAAVVLAFAPELFVTKRGRVRVATKGLCKGQTVLDTGDKVWSFPNAWEEGERPAIAVALDVDVEKVMALFRARFGIER
jgi:uridine nucleosidase